MPSANFYSTRPRQHQRDVVRLLHVADPIIDCRRDQSRDLVKGKIAVLPDHIHQPMLTKLSELVLWFRDAVAVSDEDVAWPELHYRFIEGEIIEQADHRAALVEATQRAIFADDDRRQVPAVAVSEFSR